MLKKKIQFKDLDGNLVEQEFYFHISKADLAEMELSMVGGLRAHLQHALDKTKTEPRLLIDAVKMLIRTAYGVRSIDGKHFYKDPEHFRDFQATDAYSELFYELVTNAEAASEFVNGTLKDTVGDLSKQIEAHGGAKTLDHPKGDVTVAPATELGSTTIEIDSGYTEAQLLEMPRVEFEQVMSKYSGKNTPRQLLMIAMRRQASNVDDRPNWLREGRKPSIEEISQVSPKVLEKYNSEIMQLVLLSENNV